LPYGRTDGQKEEESNTGQREEEGWLMHVCKLLMFGSSAGLLKYEEWSASSPLSYRSQS